MTRQAILGIDAGTTALKSVIISLTGEVLGSARASLIVNRPEHDRAEQDMECVWRKVVETISSAIAAAGSTSIVAVSVTGQGDGAWLIDATGQPTGPALLWLDGRGGRRVADWQRDGRAEAVREVTGSALFPGALPILLEELETEHPERITASEHQLNCKDWIRYRLTGEIATDPTEASRTYLDVRTGEYSQLLINRLGHKRFERFLAPVAPSTSIAGTITESAASITGLTVGLPVTTGMVDTPLGGIGLGITSPGHAYAIMGTTSFVGAIQPQVKAAQEQPIITLSFDGRGSVLECFAPMNGTPNLDWARDSLGMSELGWDDIQELAAQAPPGAAGVLYLPYASTSGERAPFVDTDASASWINLSAGTTRSEMIRAVYEGMAQSLRECMDELGLASESVVKLSGGGAQSDTICRILADVSGRSIERSTDTELGARGSAALALVATGRADNIEIAMDTLRTTTQRFEPEIGLREFYDQQARVFVNARNALRNQWSDLRLLRADSHSVQLR